MFFVAVIKEKGLKINNPLTWIVPDRYGKWMKFSSLSSMVKILPVRIVIPVVLTFVLFLMAAFLFIIPRMEQQMMAGKRTAVMQLTEAAWSTLAHYNRLSQEGMLSREAAQQSAVAHLNHLRFGEALKDYVWINDMTPEMVMHPYRPDLVGQDVGDFTDPSGKKIFVEMVALADQGGGGFVRYLWQHWENPEMVVPKISYIKGFEPWGWIVGTGIYVEDVVSEIHRVSLALTWAFIGIMGVVAVLYAVIIREALWEKRRRLLALEDSRNRERQLVQADKMASLGMLTAGMAHEINNPAAIIMLNATSLKKTWEAVLPILDGHFKNDPRAKVGAMAWPDLRIRMPAMVGSVLEGAGRIKQITMDLKDFSRPAAVSMDENIQVENLVARSLEFVHPILKKATRELSVDVGSPLPLIRGNFQKLQQVMINLLMNSAQALTHPSQAICLRVGHRGDFLIMEVADQGPGVSETDLARLRDPFFTRRREGTGLGLPISEKIIQDHGGTLELSSELGRGFTARVLLPLSLK